MWISTICIEHLIWKIQYEKIMWKQITKGLLENCMRVPFHCDVVLFIPLVGYITVRFDRRPFLFNPNARSLITAPKSCHAFNSTMIMNHKHLLMPISNRLITAIIHSLPLQTTSRKECNGTL